MEKSDDFDKFIKQQKDTGKADNSIQIIGEGNGSGFEIDRGVAPRVIDETVDPAHRDVTSVILQDVSGTPGTMQSDILSLREIKSHIAKGRYVAVTDGNVDKSNYESLYYQGIANFIRAKQARGKQKETFIRNAELLFNECAKNASAGDIKARSVLWHGITRYVFKPDTLSRSELLRPFEFIQNNYKNTKYHNDSLLYSGLVLLKKGSKSEADNFFKKLSDTSAKDRVYDEDYRKWVSPQTAAAHYLKSTGKKRDSGTVSKNGALVSSKDAESESKALLEFSQKIDAIHKQISEAAKESGETTDDTEDTASVSDSASDSAQEKTSTEEESLDGGESLDTEDGGESLDTEDGGSLDDDEDSLE